MKTLAPKMRGFAQQGNERLLRRLVVAAGLCCAVAFVGVALAAQLELYGDGAMFSYAVAVRDVWAFHWHNISGRTSVYLLTLLPAEAMVALTGAPWAGIVTYGLLFYVAPLAGIAATFVVDRSPDRTLFTWACAASVLLAPLVFGFPTEMWLAQAIFWPTLAFSHYAPPSRPAAVATALLWTLLAFTHEGAFVLLIAIIATLSPRGLRSAPFLRGLGSLAVALVLAVAVKLLLPPDSYYVDAFVRAALHFFDPAIFNVEIVLVLLTTVAGYLVLWLALSRLWPARACLAALVIVAAALCVYWLRFDQSVHASSRYYLRTALVVLIPLFGMLAAASAMMKEGVIVMPARLQPSPATRTAVRCALVALFCATALVHLVETTKFVLAWSRYRTAVAALATGSASDPELGSPRFVSSKRGPADLAPLEWFSTIPYLSVILSDFRPGRLVIDPAGNYFWLSCATATANAERNGAVPSDARQLVRIYSCLHR